MDPPDDGLLQADLVDEYAEPSEDRWDVGGIEVPEDDNVFREQLELSPQERAMLDQYSGENRGLRNLDSALRDAVQMVQVSDQRITYLRKMHALLLLRKVKGALQSYEEEEGMMTEDEDDARTRRTEGSRGGRDLLPEDYPEFSSEDDDDQLSRDSALRSARKHKQLLSRRGPNSDDFIPVKGGSDFGGHSRGDSLGGKEEESIFDPEEALLIKDEEEGAVHAARPFYTDSGALAPSAFDSDLEMKVDADSGSSGSPPDGTPPDGSTIEKPEADSKEARAAAKRAEDAAYDRNRFAKRYKQKRRISWAGSTVVAAWILAFGVYMFIRVTKTLELGSYLIYGIFVLGVEVLGATTTLIYGTNLIFTPVNPEMDRFKRDKPKKVGGSGCCGLFGRKKTGGKKGDPQLPVSSDVASVKSGDLDGDLEEGGVGKDPDFEEPPPTGQYHIRVLIPCYKEPEDIVRQTVAATRTAVLPPGCHRTIYVCDDGKDKAKRRMCQRAGRDVQYVSGRTRPPNEMNGKSGNLNNACSQIYPAGCKIPDNEVICVMDADQIMDPTFFLKMIPMMDGGDDVGMVLSPQCFHNLNQEGDIFNHSNIHFWEYMQPGYDALGFISCTGTNFLIRSKAFQECGWSPEYTLTEDFALGMELKMRQWQCRYVSEYLAVGEAPDQVRNCFQQRSRWCKGHFQVMFSKQHCPLFQRRLSLFMKILFCSGVWSYIVASIATPTFILVPLLTIWFGIFPIVLSAWAALGLSVYYVATTLVLNFAHSRKHIMPLWFSNVSTVIMFWTYIKALFRSVIARWTGGIKFKTTLKGLGRLQDSAFGDLIVPTIVLLMCTVSLGIGIGKVIHNASGVKTTLLVSLAWMIFNMIPPYLLLHYQFIGRGTTLKIVCKLSFYVSFLVGIAALVLIWLLYPKGFDYPGAIKDNITYYQSMMVGAPPANGGFGVSWRSSAYTQDAQSPIVAPLTSTLGSAHDSSGGWMTGGPGGNIKMTQPIAFTTAMLSWGLLSFPKGYGGSRNGVLQQIQVGAEFLKKTLIEYSANKPDFYVIYQVGNLSTESRYWGYPEAFTGQRPSYYVPTSIGTSDLTGSMSAAFAAASLAFQNVDRAYAQGLLNLAANMYTAAKTYPGSYSQKIRASVCTSQYERSSIGPTGAVLASAGVCRGPYDAFNGSALAWYNSTSYYDDMTWAATWMYQATGQATYLNDAITFYVQHSQGPEQVYDEQLLFNWQNTFWGANLKLAQLKGDPAYHRQMQYFLKYWLCGTGGVPVQFTPLGRAWNSNDGSLGTTANAAFVAAVYANVARKKYAGKAARYVCFARTQTRYILGDSSASFLVGFGKKYSQYAQVMGASCPGFPFQGRAQNCTAAQLISKKGNPHVATGALLEQSSFTDEISIVRASNNSRTAPEYNAGLLGALAGVQVAPGNWNECLQGNGILSRDTTICRATV